MVERMESQMKSMQIAYNFEMKEIEASFFNPYDVLLESMYLLALVAAFTRSELSRHDQSS